MPLRSERASVLALLALIFVAPPTAHALGAPLPWLAAYAPLLVVASWAVLLAWALLVTLLAAHLAPGARPDFRTHVPARDGGARHRGGAGSALALTRES